MMNRVNSSIVTAVLVFALAMLVAVAATNAATPFIVKVPVDVTSTFNDCGFTVVDHNEGSITVHGLFDQNGDLKMEIDTFALKESWINPASGISLSTTDAGPAITTIQTDGSQTWRYWAHYSRRSQRAGTDRLRCGTSGASHSTRMAT